MFPTQLVYQLLVSIHFVAHMIDVSRVLKTENVASVSKQPLKEILELSAYQSILKTPMENTDQTTVHQYFSDGF